MLLTQRSDSELFSTLAPVIRRVRLPPSYQDTVDPEVRGFIIVFTSSGSCLNRLNMIHLNIEIRTHLVLVDGRRVAAEEKQLISVILVCVCVRACLCD